MGSSSIGNGHIQLGLEGSSAGTCQALVLLYGFSIVSQAEADVSRMRRTKQSAESGKGERGQDASGRTIYNLKRHTVRYHSISETYLFTKSSLYQKVELFDHSTTHTISVEPLFETQPTSPVARHSFRSYTTGRNHTCPPQPAQFILSCHCKPTSDWLRTQHSSSIIHRSGRNPCRIK